MFGFDWVRRSNYFGGELIGRAEVKLRVGKLKNGKVAGKDEVTGEMIKGGGSQLVDWIWILCKGFKTGVGPEDWRFAVIVPLYKG